MESAKGSVERGGGTSELRGQSVRGGLVTFASQCARVFIQLGSVAVLARILAPEDFGLVAMVIAFTGFLSRFKDFGLSIAAVQRAEISDAQQTGLFWSNVLIGSLLTGVVALASPVLAWLYAEPRLLLIGFALAAPFFIGGLGVQHMALLRRRLDFSSLAIIELSAILLSAGFGVIAAMSGAGYWALALMPSVSALVLSGGSWWLCGWRPGRFDVHTEMRALISFGGRLSLVSFWNSVARSFDGFFVGWQFGAAPLGLYSKAIQLSFIFVEQMNAATARVALPVLSSLQHDPERYRGYYRRGIQLVGSVSVPAAIAFFIFAEDLTLFILGPQWKEAAPLFRLLALAALFEGLRAVTSWIYLSLGHAKQQLRWAAFSAFFRVACIIVGGFWGLHGVALGYSLGAAALWLPGVLYCYQTSPIRLSDLSRVLWRPVSASLIAGVWVSAMFSFAGSAFVAEAVGAKVLLELGSFGVLYLLASVLLPGGIASARDIFSLSQEVRMGRRPS